MQALELLKPSPYYLQINAPKFYLDNNLLELNATLAEKVKERTLEPHPSFVRINKWGTKAMSYAADHNKKVPALAIGFGKDAFELFARIYKTALQQMGKAENITAQKKLPEPFQYIGWCTWNSSNLGKDLSEQHIIESVKTFTDERFPLGRVLVDEGWFQHSHSQLQSLQPDPKKFASGFKPMIQKLKTQYGIKYVGVWHAFDGYWNGIDPNSSLGKNIKMNCFHGHKRKEWTMKIRL